MPAIRVTGAQISKPARIKFTSQGVVITGVQEIFANASARLQAIADSIPGVVAESMYEASKPIFELSQRYVPVHTGALKASGFHELQRGHHKGGARVAIGYGRGGHPWYAAYVHEVTWMYHRPPTRSKFLEAAVTERLAAYKLMLLQSVQKKIGSRGRVK